MKIITYVVQNRLILIPVLYILGIFIKNTQFVKDKYIPIILLILGVIFSVLMSGNTIIDNIIQGILVSGVTVFGHQVTKQMRKDE